MQKLYFVFAFSIFLPTVFIYSSEPQVHSFFTKLSYSKPSGDDDRIRISNNFGNVSVQGWMKPQAVIQAYVTTHNLCDLSSYSLSARQKKNKTEITVVNFQEAVDVADGVDCQVFVPKTAIVTIKTTEGSVQADSMFGKRTTIKTQQGDIYVSDSSNIYAQSDCGQIDICSGLSVVEAYSGIGNIFIDGHFRSIKAESYQGDITVMSNLKKLPKVYSEFGCIYQGKKLPKTDMWKK